jgi:hypothetical protein
MPSADYAELPVVLVFRNIIPLHRIFPFDTGAFQKELYIEEIDDKYKLTEFAMNPEIDDIKKLIVAFFENNDQYWEGIATGNKNHVDGNYHREALYRLFTSTRAATYDERCYTIEIQADTHIDLNRYLCAVVASHNFLNRKDSNGMLYSDRFKAMNIHYEPYDGIGRFTPKKFQLKLNELVKKYYCSVGLMR